MEVLGREIKKISSQLVTNKPKKNLPGYPRRSPSGQQVEAWCDLVIPNCDKTHRDLIFRVVLALVPALVGGTLARNRPWKSARVRAPSMPASVVASPWQGEWQQAFFIITIRGQLVISGDRVCCIHFKNVCMFRCQFRQVFRRDAPSDCHVLCLSGLRITESKHF